MIFVILIQLQYSSFISFTFVLSDVSFQAFEVIVRFATSTDYLTIFILDNQSESSVSVFDFFRLFVVAIDVYFFLAARIKLGVTLRARELFNVGNVIQNRHGWKVTNGDGKKLEFVTR